MAVKVCLLRLRISEHGEIVLSGYYLFSVRIIYLLILRMAVACIAYSEMRSCLFNYEYRQLSQDIVLARHHICGSICSYGKFTYRQSLMVKEYILFDISLTVFRIFVIVAGIFLYDTVFKGKTYILKEISVQICGTYIENTMCTFKYRRCKHFTNRNIYIGYAVFKLSLMLGIFKTSHGHMHIRLIISRSLYGYIFSLIQHIYYALLYTFIFLVIKSIQFHSSIEYLFEIISDIRNRKSNNGKRISISRYIFIGNSGKLSVHIYRKSLLLIAESYYAFLWLRIKKLFTEAFYNSRTGIFRCSIL